MGLRDESVFLEMDDCEDISRTRKEIFWDSRGRINIQIFTSYQGLRNIPAYRI